MRVLKILAYTVGGLAVLVLLPGLAILLLVHPNAYKDRIVRQIKVSTGRELALPGDLKLSVFPWIALELGPASLSNPDGFPHRDFLSLQHAALRVKLLPLLHGELQVGRVELQGLDLYLEKNAAGEGNWESSGQKQSRPSSEVQESTGVGASLESLEGMEIRDSRIRYGTLALEHLHVTLGSSHATSVPINFGFELRRGADIAPITLSGALQASLDFARKHYVLSQVSLTGEIGAAAGKPALPWKFSAPSIGVDLAAQTVQVPELMAQLASAQLSGSLAATQVVESPSAEGALTLQPVALRPLLGQLGIFAPKLRDERALSQATFSSHYRYAEHALQLKQLKAVLDESTLTGTLALTDMKTHAASFDLRLDRIDLDRYRSPPQSHDASSESPDDLPRESLKPLEVEGSLAIGRAKVAGMVLSDATLGLLAHAGLIRLTPIRARVYGGQYSGTVTYDARGEVPALALEQQLTSIDIAPLLRDTLNSQRLSGHGNARTSLAARGRNSDLLIPSLNGQVDANLVDGAIEGLDLWYEIGLADALLRQQTVPATSNMHRTRFDDFRLSVSIANGVATARTLQLTSPYLRLAGQGTADLGSKALDLHLVTTLLKSPPLTQGQDLSRLTLAGIPVQVGGTLMAPKIRPDVQALLKSTLKKKAEDLLKDKLKDRLKGFFGRP